MASIGTPDLGVRFVETGYDDVKRKVDSMAQSIRGATPALEGSAKAAEKTSINLKQLSFAVFGASLSITSLVTGFSRLDKAQLNIEKTQVAIIKSTNTLATQELRYQILVDKGQGATERARITFEKIKATKEDLRVKTDSLRIAEDSLRDTYINLAASLASSVFFTISSLVTVFKNVELATVKAGLATIFLRRSQEGAVFSSTAMTAANVRLAWSNVLATGTTQGLVVATRLLGTAIKTTLAAIGPLGWAIIAVASAYEVYATNAFGVQDKLHQLLGIETEAQKQQRMLAEATGELGDEYEGLTGSLTGTVDASEQFLLPSLEKIRLSFKGLVDDVDSATTAVSNFQSTASGQGMRGRGGAGAGVAGAGGGVPGVGGGMMSPELAGMFGLIPFQETVKNQLDAIIQKGNREKEIREEIDKVLEKTSKKTEAILLMRSIMLERSGGELTLELRLLDLAERKLNYDKDALRVRQDRVKALKEEEAIEERLAKKKRENLRDLALALGFGGRTPAMEGIPDMTGFMASLQAGQHDKWAETMALARLFEGIPSEMWEQYLPTGGFTGGDRERQAKTAAQLLKQGPAKTLAEARARAYATQQRVGGIFKAVGQRAPSWSKRGGHKSHSTTRTKNAMFISRWTKIAMKGGLTPEETAAMFNLPQFRPTWQNVSYEGMLAARERSMQRFVDNIGRGREHDRNLIEISEREALLGGFEAQRSREERFLAHIGEFGVQSVMAGGGTSLATDIPGLSDKIYFEVNRLFEIRNRQMALESMGIVKVR